MAQKETLVLASDFDGTTSDTFTGGPGVASVTEACERAVLEAFGPKGHKLYLDQGGLRNRSPIQTVADLVEACPKLIETARQTHASQNKVCSCLVPEGLGGSFDWDQAPLLAATELLVRLKLKALLPQIGKSKSGIWPQPCPGFIEFWRWLHKWARKEGIEIATAIISSGHHGFIEKVWQVYGLTPPGALISDDTIRAQRVSDEGLRAQFCKPSPIPFWLACSEWVKLGNGSHRKPWDPKQVLYCGDDRAKDGGMAQAAGLQFAQHDPKATFSIQSSGLIYANWMQIATWLEGHTAGIKAGKTISELVKGDSS